MSLPELKLDWCSHKASEFAVKHWHYSRKMPVGKLAKIGVWEGGKFIGVVLFGLGGGGACDGRRYGLGRNFEIAELQRIALTEHENTVSRIIAVSVRILRRLCPKLRMLISYADPAQGHHGGVYQASGWIFTGKSADDWKAVWPNGKEAHSRIAHVHVQFGLKKTIDITGAKRVPIVGKYRYLMPLDDEMRKRIEPLRKPYPKRVRSDTDDTAGDQSAKGGSTPTRTLQVRKKKVLG